MWINIKKKKASCISCRPSFCISFPIKFIEIISVTKVFSVFINKKWSNVDNYFDIVPCGYEVS
jgi:hypothetical protein